MTTTNRIWCDLETTGLDETAPGAAILEIALVAVDNRLNEVAHWHTALRVSPRTLSEVQLNPRLLELHSNSGLWGVLQQDAQQMRKPEYGGLPLAQEAEAIALQFMQAYAPPNLTPIGGANSGFDLRWLRRCMPHLAERFHYRPYDTNAFFLTEEWLLGGASAKVNAAHRALDDCRASIETVRRFFGAGRAA